MKIISLVLCFVFFAATVCGESAPRVETPLGTIEGVIDKSINGRRFFSFEGVPYARPPVGKYRFKEPVPPKPWEGTWQAKTKHVCLQYDHFSLTANPDPVIGQEDCLYLNVYTPDLNPKKKLNVIVYIHGGAFIFGSGQMYQSHILMDRDVVYVSLNYRLGPLGFLSTEDDVVPGNNGLRDQIMALTWVKNNIKYFGGDPESITLFGMSAGGASVHFHYLTPKSRGLFTRGISQSGCMLAPWVLMENPLERAKEVANLLGCTSKDSVSMVDCMRKRPGKQVVATVGNMQPYLFNPFSPFGAVVDGEWASDPVLPKHPYQLLTEKKVFDAPWIASLTLDEGLYPGYDFYEEKELKYIENNWNAVLPHILHYNYTIDIKEHDRVSQMIRKEYLGNKKLDRETYHDLIDAIGDRLFKVDVDKCIKLQSKATRSSIYQYLFAYRGAHSWSEFRRGIEEDVVFLGVSHADDTPYVLFEHDMNTQTTENDRKMSKIFLDAFISFAKSGKPTIDGIEWAAAAPGESPQYLRIDAPTSMKMERDDNKGNVQFWKSIDFRENENLFKIKDEL